MAKKYIDTDLLRKEIERIRGELSPDFYEYNYDAAKTELLDSLFSFIDSLQQELPEVDLDEEVHRFFEECIEVHEVPLYGKVKEGVITVDCYEITARHFYKLGKNSK